MKSMFLTMTKSPYRRCSHRAVQVTVTGGMHFAAGEVSETLKTNLVCQQCGRSLTRRYTPPLKRERLYVAVDF
jgi:hypothetical protein